MINSLLSEHYIQYTVISREIRLLAALNPPRPIQKVLYRSQWSPEAVFSCLRHLRLFLLYQSNKYFFLGGGYNAARGLISRDIAQYTLFYSKCDCKFRAMLTYNFFPLAVFPFFIICVSIIHWKDIDKNFVMIQGWKHFSEQNQKQLRNCKRINKGN